MLENLVTDYGWDSDRPPECCDYVAPRVLKLLSALAARRVLDLGAGNGALCGRMSDMGLDVVGVEYDAMGYELARASHRSVRFYRAGVQDDPRLVMPAEAPFDAVVSTEVIEHLYAPHLLPIFASRVLVPGGHLIVSTPYHGYIKNLALSVLGKWDQHHAPLWHGGHIKFWSRRTLTVLIERSGLQVVGFYGVGRVPGVWKSMVMVARKDADRSMA